MTKDAVAVADAALRAGLSSGEAARRLAEAGPNEPVPSHRPGVLVQVLPLFTNPLVLLLVVAAVVSGAVGEALDAALIVVIVFLGVSLDAAQTVRAHREAEALRGALAPTAVVVRDGRAVTVPRRDVVPGDVVALGAGDLVPADAALLSAKDLHVSEAALTGESLPVEKRAGDTVYLGTSVASGAATAVVTATGPRTSFGAVAARLAERPPETEFERGLKRFGALIAKTVLFLVVFVFFVGALSGRDVVASLLFAVALAVGLTPEFLPMITTVTLTRGARRMADRDVLVKSLASIQNLGSIDVLASDKTGTLTSGAMTLAAHVDATGAPSERAFLLAYLNSFHETGLANPLDAAIRRKGATTPLDDAILAHEHPDVAGSAKLDEIPFDFERRRLSVVVALSRGGTTERLLVTKGAPDAVLPLCGSCDAPAAPPPRAAEPSGLLESARRVAEAAEAEGRRVLAVAYRAVPERPSYGVEDETGLTLAGLLLFEDPLLPDAQATLADLARDGVVVKILTGDAEAVARHVAQAVGLDGRRVVLGAEIDRMSDAALQHVAEEASVFARVSPVQKHRLLLALKSRGHVVGFLGDGINDAPSLKAADVGISVAGAAEVARDAADVILKARGLSVLHAGIVEGRRAFGNVMKFLLMETSSNFGNMFSMAAAALFLPFLPMLPTQILLNNFLYDLAQLAIPTDRVDETFLKKPRRWDTKAIRSFMVTIGPISSLYDLLTFAALLLVFRASEALFHTGWFVESLATQALVVFVIRTGKSPLKSRPSRPLVLATTLVAATAVLLPYSPLAPLLGFVPMPPAYLVFVLGVVATYLLLVEAVKRRVMGRLLA